MEKKYLSMSAAELLQEFGKGKHKPGSGSAAAFEGLLAAQLLRTVISITAKPKWGTKYEESLPELHRINSEIEKRIYPELENLCEGDAVEFGNYIPLVKQLRLETDSHRRAKLQGQKYAGQRVVTSIPLKIAGLCEEIAYFALFVFDHGVEVATGDAAVALNAALASMTGCFSIIDLNLSDYPCDDWAIKIRSDADELRTEYKALNAQAIDRMSAYEVSCRKKSYEFTAVDIQSGKWEQSGLTNNDIEKLARQIQNILWIYKDFVWIDEIPGTYIDLLKPEVAIEKLLGYQFSHGPLGTHTTDEGTFRIAGQIDKSQKHVQVSDEFDPAVQNFTAAHELGHALLHKIVGTLHRDRPLDGSTVHHKDDREREANKFATYFLMPAKQVIAAFRERFLMEKFTINNDTLFLLDLRGETPTTFKENKENLRRLTLFLSSVEHFKGNNFYSIANLFNVSEKAMAIRMEELGLIEF